MKTSQSKPTAPSEAQWQAMKAAQHLALLQPVLEGNPTGSGAGGVRVELRLLQQARAAMAREDFVLAIQLLAEHARRFRAGRLVEEREALRVRSLAGLGRHGAARRAAADFEATLPRSPLLQVFSWP